MTVNNSLNYGVIILEKNYNVLLQRCLQYDVIFIKICVGLCESHLSRHCRTVYLVHMNTDFRMAKQFCVIVRFYYKCQVYM